MKKARGLRACLVCALNPRSVAAHTHLGELVQRERRGADRAQGEGEERQLVVVAGDAVCAELAAAGALVDDGPLAV